MTKLLGTSAWYAPGASVAYLVNSILQDQKRIIPCSVLLEGEYGQSDICIGVPTIIGKNGWEKIVDLNLTNKESASFEKSVLSVRSMNKHFQEFPSKLTIIHLGSTHICLLFDLNKISCKITDW